MSKAYYMFENVLPLTFTRFCLFTCLYMCPLCGGCDSTLRLCIQYVHSLGRTSSTTATLKGQRFFMSRL